MAFGSSRRHDEDLAHQAIHKLMGIGNSLLAQLKAGQVTLASAKAQAATARAEYVDYRNSAIRVDSVRRAMMNEYDPARCEYICAFDKLVLTFDAYAPAATVSPLYVAPVTSPLTSPVAASVPLPIARWNTATGGDLPIVDYDTIGTESPDTETQSAAASFLENQIGPLPLWAWITIAVAGYAIVKGGKL